MPEAIAFKKIYQPLYDTVQLAAAAGQTVTFFQSPLNDIISGAVRKSFAHTNIRQNAMLEKGQSFWVKGYSMFVREVASTGGNRVTFVDYQTIMGGFVQIKLGSQNVWGTYPVALIPAGCGELNYFSNITAAPTEFHANHGLSSAMNILALDPEEQFAITAQEALSVELTVPGTPGAVTDVTFVIHGSLLLPA